MKSDRTPLMETEYAAPRTINKDYSNLNMNELSPPTVNFDKDIVPHLSITRNYGEEDINKRLTDIHFGFADLLKSNDAKHILLAPYLSEDKKSAIFNNFRLILDSTDYQLQDPQSNNMLLVNLEGFSLLYFNGYNEQAAITPPGISTVIFFISTIHNLDFNSNDSLLYLENLIQKTKKESNVSKRSYYRLLATQPLLHESINISHNPIKILTNAGLQPFTVQQEFETCIRIPFIGRHNAINQTVHVHFKGNTFSLTSIGYRQAKKSNHTYVCEVEPQPFLWQEKQLLDNDNEIVHIFTDLIVASHIQQNFPRLLCTSFVGGKAIVDQINWEILRNRKVKLICTKRINEDLKDQLSLMEYVNKKIKEKTDIVDYLVYTDTGIIEESV